jgi:uncharacterized membrane protein YfcA
VHWTPTSVAVLTSAAFAAGAVNSIAGGGSLLTFPALLVAGLSPLGANATSTVALVPGSIAACWSYREHLRGQSRAIAVMALPSLAGGALGALVLLRAGDSVFARVVPWLLLGATALFASQEALARWRARRGETLPDEPSLATPSSILALAAFQLFVATYGGFFGAGIGILMLAALAIAGFREIHRMNALKNLAAAVINGVAVVLFLRAGAADLPVAGVMAVAAVAGGRSGAQIAQRVGPARVRRAVTVVGLTISAVLLARSLASGH